MTHAYTGPNRVPLAPHQMRPFKNPDRWPEQNVAILQELYALGHTDGAIAIVLGTTALAVQHKRRILGLGVKSRRRA